MYCSSLFLGASIAAWKLTRTPAVFVDVLSARCIYISWSGRGERDLSVGSYVGVGSEDSKKWPVGL